MKRYQNQIITFLLASVFLVFGTGCQVFHKQHRSRGVIIESRPAGRKSVEKEEKDHCEKGCQTFISRESKETQEREDKLK